MSPTAAFLIWVSPALLLAVGWAVGMAHEGEFRPPWVGFLVLALALTWPVWPALYVLVVAGERVFLPPWARRGAPRPHSRAGKRKS